MWKLFLVCDQVFLVYFWCMTIFGVLTVICVVYAFQQPFDVSVSIVLCLSLTVQFVIS